MDINERAVHIYRDPAAEGYRFAHTARVGESVACAALPELAVEVGELFPG